MIRAIGLLAALAAFAQATPMVRMSIVFGNNAGLEDEKPLLFATRDAEQIHATLLELGGSDKGGSVLLLDPPVSRVMAAFWDARKRVGELRKQGKKVQLLIYYSGHGGDAALHMNGEKLPLESIRDYFRQSEADLKLLVADACYSGSLIQGKGATLSGPVPVKYLDELKVNGSAIITSSSAGEMAQESKELQGSIFTHHFLTALRGAGDADRDGQVTLWEAYNHAQAGLRHQLASHNAVAQTPEFDIDIQGSDNVVLTRLNLGQSFLAMRNLPLGQYRVLEAGSALQVAEVRLANPEGVVLALPRGSYLVYRISGRDGQAAYADLRKQRRVELGPGSLRPVSAGALSSKGMLGPRSLGRLSRGPLHVSAEPRLYSAFPGRDASALAFEGSLRLNAGDFGASLGGGYLPEYRGTAGVNRFAQEAWFVTGEGRYFWNYSRFGAAYLGPRVESWSVGQSVNGIRFARGSLLGGFGMAGLERAIAYGLSFHASIGAGAFWSYDTGGNLVAQFCSPLSLGLRFGP